MSEFVEAWREASWQERLEAAVFALKFSPVLIFGFVWLLLTWWAGERDDLWSALDIEDEPEAEP